MVDTETTGLDPAVDRILEIAAIRITADGVELDRFSTLVAPPSGIPWKAREHFAQAPSFADIAPWFHRFSNGSVIAAHNAAFDRNMVSAELIRYDEEPVRAPWLDTLAFAWNIIPDAPSYSLSGLAAHLDLSLGDDRQWHTAVGDAEVTAALLVRLLQQAHQWGIESTVDLGISEPTNRRHDPDPGIPLTLVERDHNIWPPRSPAWRPSPLLDQQANSPNHARQATGISASLLPTVVSIPQELIDRVRALAAAPAAVAFRRERDAKLEAAGNSVIDLDDAFALVDGERLPPAGQEGLDLVRKALHTLKVADYLDDAIDGAEEIARYYGRTRHRLEAATLWADCVTLAAEAYTESPDEYSDVLDLAVSEGLDRAARALPGEAVRIIDTVIGAAHGDDAQIDNLTGAISALLSPDQIDVGAYLLEAFNRHIALHPNLRPAADRMTAAKAHSLERLGRSEEALDILETLHHLGTHESLVYDRITLIHERAGNLKEALLYAVHAIDHGLDSKGSIHNRAARIRRKLDRLTT